MLKIFTHFIFHFRQLFRRSSLSSITIQYPYVQRQVSTQGRTKFRLDLPLCTGCEACEEVCPTQAVKIDFLKNSRTFLENGLKDVQQISIDYGKCINCGWCVDVCEPKALVFEKKKLPFANGRNELVDGLVKIKNLPDMRG